MASLTMAMAADEFVEIGQHCSWSPNSFGNDHVNMKEAPTRDLRHDVMCIFESAVSRDGTRSRGGKLCNAIPRLQELQACFPAEYEDALLHCADI